MSDPSLSSAERRRGLGLTLDPVHRRLSMGVHSITLPAGVDNRAVLDAYVELAAKARDAVVANLVHVRQEDVEALAAALDLDARDLAAQVEEVLGASRAQAVAMVSRLRSTRLIGGLGRAATGT